ncbi:MAG: rubrerythrin family protein [Candidatus Woesearchaeota archaeon]
MPLRQLKSLYEKRKLTLEGLLKSGKLTSSRKEQIHGAITEIDSFLKTIDTFRDQEIQDNRKLDEKTSLNLSSGIFKNIQEKIKSKFDSSQTRKNLMLLFLKKCETTVRYEFYSKLAKTEGYESIAHLFKELSDEEKEHAKVLFKHLNWDGKTKSNIIESADIERQCHTKMYDEFEDTALKEKFKEIAEFIKDLSEIEAEHEKKFLKLLKVMHDNRIFAAESIVRWRCRNCGHLTDSKEAPKKCRVCKKTQGYFEIHRE